MHTMLACRTDFSVGESILTIDELLSEAKANGQSVVGVTETMSVTSLIDFNSRALKAGLKPITGVRLRMTDNPTWRPGEGEKKKHMPRTYHVTVYPRTKAAMQGVFRLLTLANSSARFYYFAKLGWDDLYTELDRDPDGYALTLGDDRGIFEHPRADHIIGELKARCARLYAPILPIATPYYGRLNQMALDAAAKHGLKTLLIRPAFYARDRADAQEIMRAIHENHEVTSGLFRSRLNRDMHPMSLTEILAQMKASIHHLNQRGTSAAADPFKEALRNTVSFADDISYHWEKEPVSLPQMAPDEFAAVREECQKGWRERFADEVFGHKPSAEELRDIYMPRLKYELSVLNKLNFSGYFLLVQDIVRFAKTNGILVGPGRGSVGGSLVAYLMGITECDPIRFGLLFERFINPERIDLPDADLDFMSDRRHEIVDYLVSKYGAGRVAGVSNFGSLAAASVIRDVGRVMGIPERQYSVSKLVPKLHGQPLPLPDARKEVPEIAAFASAHAGCWEIMMALEGKIRNFATHAAGIVVGGCDLVERAVLETRKDGTVVCWDKQIVESQGLVKVDILGLNNLDVIALTCNYIRERHGKAPDLHKIPLDDPKVLERFALGKTTGIFQFDGSGMRRLLRELGADGTITFDDITAATALYRPGPMESGMMNSYYLRKQGNESVDYDHPLMEPVLRDTYGVIVYQEQVMRVAQVIAGYSGADADKLRKIMGKKLPEEMKKERGKFVEGAVNTIGCTEEWAGELFDRIESFAGYGFNKSHSTTYTLISYQCMWLKTYYPVEFCAACLTRFDEDKLPNILRDAKNDGITVDVPDINHSTGRFEIVTDTRLVMPFQAIKGLSEKTTEAILAARASGRFMDKTDFLNRIEKRRVNAKHQDCLDRVGAFAWIEPGQIRPDDKRRLRDQIELLPGLISAAVPIDHDLNRDKDTKEAIAALHDDARVTYADAGEGMPTKPHFGRKARFMIVSDAPSGEEDGNGIFGIARSNSAVLEAMQNSDLDLQDVYWTGLIKRPKREKQVTPEEIAIYKDYLAKEIELLHPPVIVLLGSQAVRNFLPAFKGKASEAAAKIIHFSDLETNVVIGFSPGEIYHDPDKQNAMNEVFAAVANLLN